MSELIRHSRSSACVWPMSWQRPEQATTYKCREDRQMILTGNNGAVYREPLVVTRLKAALKAAHVADEIDAGEITRSIPGSLELARIHHDPGWKFAISLSVRLFNFQYRVIVEPQRRRAQDVGAEHLGLG